MLDVASVVFGAYNIYNQQKLHRKELFNAKNLHKQSVDLSKKLTNKSLVEVKRFYLLELFNNLAQHFQQLNADLIASAKEAERDMFDQRNQSLQTIILSASVMFGALSTAIVNGLLTAIQGESQTIIIYGYGICSAISFGALFISIVLCIETVIRASLFMYHRAQYFTFVLQEAIEQTRTIMGQMRQKTENLNVDKMVKIAKMSKKQLNEEWKEHAKIIKKYLQHRKNINHRLAAFRGGARAVQANNNNHNNNDDDENDYSSRYPRGSGFNRHGSELYELFCCCHKKRNNYTKLSEMTFNEFWEEKCEFYANWALQLFYLGTGCLILTICFYLYSKFNKEYNNLNMAIVSAGLVGIFFLFGLITARFLRAGSRKFRVDVEDDQEMVDEEDLKRRKKEDEEDSDDDEGEGDDNDREETIRDDDYDDDEDALGYSGQQHVHRHLNHDPALDYYLQEEDSERKDQDIDLEVGGARRR